MRIAVLLVAALACKSGPDGQSFHDGVQALCDLPDHVPPPGESYDQRLAAVDAWAHDHITNPSARLLGGVKALETNRQALTDAVHKAEITRCKLLDNGMALQSFGDAMTALCAAPGHPDPAYVRDHLLNPEVIRLVASIDDLNPAERAIQLRAALARAGLARCPSLVVAPKVTIEHAPRVQGAGFVELDPNGPLLVATPTGIVVDGKAIVPIENGAIDPQDLEGGALGILIPRLRDFVEALVAARRGAVRLQVAIDPALTYKVLIDVLFSTRAAGIQDHALVVRVGDAVQAIPLRLPTKAEAQMLEPGKRPAALGLFVAITGDKLVLWSLSGAEGTLRKPKLTAHGTDELAKALAEIIDRRWHGRARGALDRRIIALASGADSMQRVAEVLAAVRARPDGQELFPDVLLSSGFE